MDLRMYSIIGKLFEITLESDAQLIPIISHMYSKFGIDSGQSETQSANLILNWDGDLRWSLPGNH